jgi:hypothetical protein
MGYMLHGERLLDYLIERGGLADFVDDQFQGVEQPWSDDDWDEVRRRIWHLCGKAWQPTTGLLRDMYERQRVTA